MIKINQVPGSKKLGAHLEKLACVTASVKIAIFRQFGKEQLWSDANRMYSSPKSPDGFGEKPGRSKDKSRPVWVANAKCRKTRIFLTSFGLKLDFTM